MIALATEHAQTYVIYNLQPFIYLHYEIENFIA